MVFERLVFRSVLVLVVVVMPVVGGGEEHLGVVPGEVSGDTVLDVAAEETLLAEGVSVLNRVDSPAHVSAEEEGTFVTGLNALVQVELEELLGVLAFHAFYLNL
jgi:hypothetical protein